MLFVDKRLVVSCFSQLSECHQSLSFVFDIGLAWNLTGILHECEQKVNSAWILEHVRAKGLPGTFVHKGFIKFVTFRLVLYLIQ